MSKISIESIIEFVVLIVVICGGVFVYQNFIHPSLTEISGTAKYSDCRQQVTLNDEEYAKQTGTFICEGYLCVKTEMIDSQCQTAYIYAKTPPPKTCESYEHMLDNGFCAPNKAY